MTAVSRLQDAGWRDAIGERLEQPPMSDLLEFLQRERRAGKPIHPRQENLFAALDATPLARTKVVILGQDPYHGVNQAQGFSFSVPPETPIPPSLRNIFKELQRDLGIAPADHGCLIPWARQGVLLLNSVLSVEQGKPASHQKRGWESFTDACIAAVNQGEGVVFMLWGAYAQAKAGGIDADRHLVLHCAHPSPLSAHRGFLGCSHFSRANTWLQQRGQEAIDWRLPNRAALAAELSRSTDQES